MPRVLLVEDDPIVQMAVQDALTKLGHTVRSVGTAATALREAASQQLDLVILDLGLPDFDGLSVLRMLRGVSDVPVIIATARNQESSVVMSLNAGADDYIIKPFSGEHLAARINALLRRTGKPDSESGLLIGELKVDVAQREVILGTRPIALTRREFDLLAHLAEQAGRVVTRRELYQAVWRQPYVSDDKTIDVHVSWLRSKLGETAANPRYVHTVRGVGFKLVAPQ